MFNYFFRQIFASCGIFFRTFKAFFTRKLTGCVARVRRMTNFSRQASKVASDSFQSMATAVKKPTKREDFIETRRLFISKSFLVLLVIALIALAVFFYFVVWPFLLSHFFTVHFYEQDGQVGEWTGRVVLCYDGEKKQPKYQGKLEEGLLQGRGKAFDENGLLLYDGNFIDGVFSGEGRAYEEGVLSYEGQFSAGVPHGLGKRYQNSVSCYEGGFSQGVYSGDGVAYYPSGAVHYKGQFVDGVYEGLGTDYYENGARRYVGGFSAGSYEGDGTEYDQTGRVQYKGSFSLGKYSGAGVYSPVSGQSITADFEAGVTTGTIRWHKNGMLYYEGGSEDVTPSGFGTIYSTTGQVLYEGQMIGGTLDGGWLTTLTAEDARIALGGVGLIETPNPLGGFTITSAGLGVSLLCSYLQDDAEPMVYDVYLHPNGTDPNVSLLPWARQTDFSRWLGTWLAVTQPIITKTFLSLPSGVPAQSGSFSAVTGQLETGVCRLLNQKAGGPPSLLHWSTAVPMPLPPAEVPETAGDAAENRMENLLSALDLIEGAKTTSGGAPAPSGGTDPGAALLGAASPAAAKQSMDALLDYLQNAEAIAALMEKKPMLEDLLAEAQDKLGRGAGEQSAVDALTKDLEGLSSEQDKCTAAMKKATLTLQSVGGPDPATCDLQTLTLVFDPSQMKATDLVQMAVAYAQAVAETPAQVDAVALELEIKLALIDLGTAHLDVQTALAGYQSAAAAAQTASGAYGMGSISKRELYDALGKRADSRSGLYTTMTGFTRYANHLNSLTGGWVSRTCGWFPDAFQTVFETELKKAADAAKARAEAALPVIPQPTTEPLPPLVAPTETPAVSPVASPAVSPVASPAVSPVASPVAVPSPSPNSGGAQKNPTNQKG